MSERRKYHQFRNGICKRCGTPRRASRTIRCDPSLTGKIPERRGFALVDRATVIRWAGMSGHLNRTHGETRGGGKPTVEYSAWQSMIARCENVSNKSFKDYGGRGISVCSAWRKDFAAFLAEVGRRPGPGHSIHRIDNDRGYEPGNVKWATRAEQNSLKRNNHRLVVSGVSRTIAEWARVSGISQKTIGTRLRNGWSEEEAVSTAVDSTKVNRRYVCARLP